MFFGEPAKLAKAREAARQLQSRGGRTLSKLPHILHILPPTSVAQAQDDNSCGSIGLVSDIGSCDSGNNLGKEDEELIRRPEESEEAFLIRNCR